MTAKIERFIEGNFFLSNFYPVEIVGPGDIKFRTVEHAYMASKSLRPLDWENIKKAHHPGVAKRLGQKVTLRPDWEHVKLDVMWGLLIQKFTPNTYLAGQLLATNDAELVEGNFHGDKYWGICLKTGVGENHLGTLLMSIRDNLRQ